ncbi:hypothetical protein [Haloarcula sp. Atlit-47R]|uniref:hypothetical protein n=1 Tax=Haloarcula sp. Atlit-47R TaxID=2282132 RepID=UPI000EF1AEC6|nr:hypothetical protein [Haloarcula sp. Atlit-47R]
MKSNVAPQRIALQPETRAEKRFLAFHKAMVSSWADEHMEYLTAFWTFDIEEYPDLNHEAANQPSQPGGQALVIDSQGTGVEIDTLLRAGGGDE